MANGQYVLKPESNAQNFVDTLLSKDAQIILLGKQIDALNNKLKLTLDQAASIEIITGDPSTWDAQLNSLKTKWRNEVARLTAQRKALLQQSEQQEFTQITNRVTADRAAVAAVAARRLAAQNPNETTFNVGMVTEAYLSPHRSFQRAFNLKSNNRPTKVRTADELWEKSVGHKGMIQTFVPRLGLRDVSFDAFLPADVKKNTQKRWGFQFHYNPGSIDMTYAGIPDIDVGFVASGQDPFNLVGTQVSQSSISFQLILNRVFDMQYYDTSGRLRADAPPSLYSPSRPTVEDQAAIYNRGTMYDVEFLLRTILGFSAATQFRGDTADLGWIGGHPVEIRLGKSLHYLAMTQGAALRHIIFNERMIPTFSTLSLTFNRIPDYSSGDVTAGPRGINSTTPAAPAPPAGGGAGGFLRPI